MRLPLNSAWIPSPFDQPIRGACSGEPGNTEAYALIDDNRFLAATANPLSTFSIDVDAASYSNVRRFLSQGSLPPADAVRLEELVNYFPYDYPDPHRQTSLRGDYRSRTTAHGTPTIGWSGSASRRQRVATAGSASEQSRLSARRFRARCSRPTSFRWSSRRSGAAGAAARAREDRVAIVVYAGAAGLVLPSTSGADKATILGAIDRLEAGGSTAGGAGLKLAYDVAREDFICRKAITVSSWRPTATSTSASAPTRR